MCAQFALIFLTLLVFDKCFIVHTVVARFPRFATEEKGDPAPGRSPGPPEIVSSYHKDDKGFYNNFLPSKKTVSDCILKGEVNTTDNFVNLTINHRIFKSELLVSGINYEVFIESKNNDFPIEFTLSSQMGEEPIGYFSGTEVPQMNCGSSFVKGIMDFSTHLNWTYSFNDIMKNNAVVIFQLRYRRLIEKVVHQITIEKEIIKDCHLWFKLEETHISWQEFPNVDSCQTWFPSHEVKRGLVIELLRLNVPCLKGHIYFSGLNFSQYQHIHGHKQPHLCGKLEELSDAERNIYFPSSNVSLYFFFHGFPTFNFSYKLVDYCYNVTFLTRNGTFDLYPSNSLKCNFKIHVPYGNRISLSLKFGNTNLTDNVDTNVEFSSNNNKEVICSGILVQFMDGEHFWWYCAKDKDVSKEIQTFSKRNIITLRVLVTGSIDTQLQIFYKAQPITEIVERCAYGWIAIRPFCVSVIDNARLTWNQAEVKCTMKGGHLASIRNEHAQNILDTLLINSPGYQDENAYWIGASDKNIEGDFRWNDGHSFSYANWFPGWPQYENYNKQPNDDGLSEQDCVEIRKMYSLPTATLRLVDTFMWNDRDCSATNYYICERLQSDEPIEDSWQLDCNRSVHLSRQYTRTTLTNPGFPRSYPDNIFCEIEVTAPLGYKIALDFEELVLESEPACSYDYLEIIELSNTSTHKSENSGKRICGDWSSKLKLLRYISKGSRLKLIFNSDYSHNFSGYKIRVSMENVIHCSDDRLQMFNNSCYLFVSYPEVTWSTAQQICNGMQAQLTSVLNPEEEKFITTNIRRSPEYRTNAIFWFGAHSTDTGKFNWIDGNSMTYSSWRPSNILGGKYNKNSSLCLGAQWLPPSGLTGSSGLYWKPFKCNSVGGYICKQQTKNINTLFNFNKTVNGSEGHITSPNYPNFYYNNLDFFVKIVGPMQTRIIVHVHKMDIELQNECLYDYIELRSLTKISYNDTIRWCGNHESDMKKLTFVSVNNKVELKFHSDYSVSAYGFLLYWHAVDVSGCPLQTLTAKEGILSSPNYPNFLLPNLNCSFNIIAPVGRRIWLQFKNYHMGNQKTSTTEENTLQIELGNQSPPFNPFQHENLLTEGTFVSEFEILKIFLKTGSQPIGQGFKAMYKTLSSVEEERVILLNNNTEGILMHLNYPNGPPTNINFVQRFVAPLGYVISLKMYHVKLSDAQCVDHMGITEVQDNYADTNGTLWYLCHSEQNENSLVPQTPIEILSYLNTLNMRQKSSRFGLFLNGSLSLKSNTDFKTKLLSLKQNNVAFCQPNPCLHHGKCISKNNKQFCQCAGHYTGLFCSLNYCELEPCIFGKCELTENSYKCRCDNGYIGINCDQKQPPCDRNPCENRGVCIEKGNSFYCRCHAWWEGTRCERRMIRIPYKPLSERMLEEPFWLGLITVTVVMGVIGLFWCAKRHFPEKIEKLLAEEGDGNRNLPSLRTSLRDQLAASGGSALASTPSPGPGVPRSIFGRLGIRKPSLLSLTSPRSSNYSTSTARTFSLDDLLKPPRRTPSPRKKRNNSTPTKKNAAEKKQILQHLVTPSINKDDSKKVSLGELIQLSERTYKSNQKPKNDNDKETKLMPDSSIALTDPKLEKKVTFARLLSKVSAEMSSGSDMELGIMQTNRLSCAFVRPSSTPPSPAVEMRSPNSTSSNQGSDTFSSSDLAIPSAFNCNISDIVNNRKHGKLPNGRPKPASADSILAMFRNFSSSSAGLNSSIKMTPSTMSPASSPQDDAAGDDESSSSSVHTPISFTSAPSESPVFYGNSQGIIEVPVIDILSGHKSTSTSSNLLHPPTILLEIPSTINKCLSPIREMPTPLPSPMPSPAITPLMHRSTTSSVNDISVDTSDEKISIEIPNISVSDEDDFPCIQDINIDPQAEDGLILEEVAAMQNSNHLKIRLAAIGSKNSTNSKTGSEQKPNSNNLPPLIIPTFTIQTPSPTQTPSVLLGSPPPQRTQFCLESDFEHASARKARNSFKDFDKPGSLDLPCNPPLITITCNLSETESDIESISPALKTPNLNSSSVGMCYLSPFSIGSRNNRTTSESNLSSSGYSSMASPGPSRCGSSNPLCSSEMEDPGPPGPNSTSLHPILHRKTPSVLSSTESTTENKSKSDCNNCREHSRRRSDSETLSDDILLESNDEGIGTDHLDEKIEDGELKSAKELEVFITAECDNKNLLDISSITNLSSRIAICSNLENNKDRLMPMASNTCKSTLQLPSIVVQNEISGYDKHLSPVCSRSESPLNDRTLGLERFSTQFYGKNKESLQDSDGLYDFSLSDKVNIYTPANYGKLSNRRKDKKSTRLVKCSSPSKSKPSTPNFPLYNVNASKKDVMLSSSATRKLSPKRRKKNQQFISSSSSSDSIISNQEIRECSLAPNSEIIKWPSASEWNTSYQPKSSEASGEETGEEFERNLHPKSMEELPKMNTKVGHLNAITNQIRLFKNLEENFKRTRKTSNLYETSDSDEDSPRATSPLLQLNKEDKLTIHKSRSIGRLHLSNAKIKRNKYKMNEFLLPRNENNRKQATMTNSGYSD